MNELYIISSGAGGTNYLTIEAIEALKKCEVVVSYTKYAKELKEHIAGKELYTSGMTHEIERCNEAIEYALSGKKTCIISNGDANVYGMATLIVELIDERDLWDKIELVSVAGVTSFLAAGAKAGAPISHDFAIISLSDRLTDINLIDKRVRLALEADFVLGIYNPKSKSRTEPYLNFLKALESVDTRIVIIAQNVGRESEKITITDTKEIVSLGLNHPEVGMSTLIIVCATATKLTKNGKVLNPRGYLEKYGMNGELKD